MLILISNDDGYQAKGLHCLIDFVSYLGAEVVCVCPERQNSGQSMALTVNGPLRIHPLPDYHGARMYAVNGTPVDCVKLSFLSILKGRRPDLVLAGINHGSNASVNVMYSGTMGAVSEGCIMGVPSIGFSLTSHDHDADFEPSRHIVREIIDQVLIHGLDKGVCLNVNIPAVPILAGWHYARDCQGRWSDEYRLYHDPSGHPYYWLAGEFVNEEPQATDTDQYFLEHGMVSVVPTTINRTLPASLVPAWLKSRV